MNLVDEREGGKTCLVQGWVKHVEGWVKQKVVPDMGLGGCKGKGKNMPVTRLGESGYMELQKVDTKTLLSHDFHNILTHYDEYNCPQNFVFQRHIPWDLLLDFHNCYLII